MKLKLSFKKLGKAEKIYLIIAKVKSKSPIKEKKWSDGRHAISDFKNGGTGFINSFLVNSLGIYTVYAKAEDGTETVESIEIKKSGSKKEIIAVICILLAAACFIIAGSYISGRRNHDPVPASSASSQPDKLDDSGDGSAIDGAYQGKSKAETLSELEKDQVVVTDNLSSSIDFASGQKGTSGSWMMENTRRNNVIMQAEVVLNGQVIAKSAAVRPGQHIESIPLSQSLSPGTATAIVYINYYSLQSQEYVGKAGYQITIVVQ